MKNVFHFSIFLAMMSIAISGCKKDVAVTGVTVSPTAVLLQPGGMQQLTATVQPGNATNKKVTWNSDNTARATVSDGGLITIPAAATSGEVTIIVTTDDGGKTANCTVTVSIPVTGITITGDASVETGKTVTLTATVVPSNASNKNVTWSSLNTGIATVNAQTGVVMGASEGTATIRATAADGSGVTADKSVTVTAPPLKTVTVGEQSVPLTARMAGTVNFAVTTTNIANGQSSTITWYVASDGTTITNAPVGITASVSALSNNTATVTVNAAATTVEGNYYFKVIIDGVQSAVATLALTPEKTVNVGAQIGTLTAGTAGSATFTVTTANIANGQAGTVTWYTTSSGTTPTSVPTGITATVSAVANNAATVTINAITAAVNGERFFRVTIDGKQSNVATLEIKTPDKSVLVGVPSGTLMTGRAGTVTFAVATTNIANGRTGTITWYSDAERTTAANAPTGITASASNVQNNAATITLTATAAIVVGTYYFGVTYDGEPSNVVSFIVSENKSPWNIGHPGYNENVKAILTGNTLTISGTGNMVDFWCSAEGEAPWWFDAANRDAIRTVIIESGVTNIGNRAFKECNNMETVTIASSVTKINAQAFYGCSSLQVIKIPNSVLSIEGDAFFNCSKLSKVEIENGSNTLQFVGYRSANPCATSGTINKYDWFSGCTSLAELHLGRNLSSWNASTSTSSPIYNIRTTLTTLTIGNMVNTIGANAFANCVILSIIRIEDGLNDLDFYWNGNSFTGCPIQTLHLGRNLITSTYGGLTSPFSGKTELSSLTIGNNVTSIIAGAFNGCTSLIDVVIPNKVTSLGSSSFYGCSELKSVVFESGIRTIAGSSFEGCTKLISITIPNTVTQIGINAFTNCRSLISVNIQDGLNDLDFYWNGNSFTGCPIQTLHLGRNLITSTYGGLTSPFRGKTELSFLTIGNYVSYIITGAFYDCIGLTDVIIPSNVSSLRSSSFYGCSELKSVVFESGISTIEGSSFEGCTKLISITIPNTVKQIGINAFTNCRSLISVDIQDGLSDLDFYWNGNSFAGCPIQTLYLGRNLFTSTYGGLTSPFRQNIALSSITIGRNVTSIVANGFSGCNGLTNITSHPTTPPTIYSDTITGVTKTIPVRVPSGSVSAYSGAQYWSLFTNYQGL